MARNKFIPIITAVSLIVLGIVIGIMGTGFFVDLIKYDRYDKNDFIDPNVYQAVFLTNDQIYFGHLRDINSDYLILNDVYYVKIGEDGSGQIVRLGAIEPHGPENVMTISKNQVLFWENLRDDSQVARTIQQIKNQ